MEEMTNGELIEKLARDDQTRKIYMILLECENIEEAKEKVKALLPK